MIKLYEKIFNRFKLLKAEINHNHKIENNYFINVIFSEKVILEGLFCFDDHKYSKLSYNY